MSAGHALEGCRLQIAVKMPQHLLSVLCLAHYTALSNIWHSSMDHILTSPELVGFPVLQRQKTVTFSKVCKVACSQVSGSDFDSNNVLDLGLDFKLKSEGRGRSTHLTGKLVPEMWPIVSTKEAFWFRESVK